METPSDPSTPPAKIPDCGHFDKKVFARGKCRGCYKKMLRAEKKQKRLDAAAAEGRWVHKVIRVFIEEIPQDVNSDDYEAKTLTEYGQQGWQLAGVLSEADESVHIFYLQKKIVPEKINPPKGEQAS